MNREIKFRAWDINKKTFIPLDYWAIVTTNFNAFGIMLKDWENYKEGEYFYEHSQVLMQFTGLKDCNGKDIYEGDLCNAWIIPKSNHEFINEVIYLDGSFGYKDSDGEFHPFATHDDISKPLIQDWEVIGNVFENPELSKKP